MKKMIKHSLRGKLSFTGFALIAGFILLNILVTYLWLVPFSTMYSAKRMKIIVNEIAHYDDIMDEDFQEYIEGLSENYNVQITLFNDQKRILATTRFHAVLSKSVTELFDSSQSKLDQGKIVVKTKDVKTTRYESNHMIAASRIEPVRIVVIKKLGENQYVALTRTLKSLQNTSYVVILFDLISGAVIIIVGCFVILRLSNYLVKPINEMRIAAEHISNLEFDAKVSNIGEDELGCLGASINKMSQHLESNIAEMQKDIELRKRLVRNLSHEVKSPVAVIMGYADRMGSVIEKKPEKALEYSKIISNESNRIDMIIKEMLDFSRLEKNGEGLSLVLFPIRTLFDNISKRIHEEYIEKTFSFEMVCDEEDCIVADYALIERAVYNLVNNAISHGAGDDLQIELRGISESEKYRICVHNTGSHIPEEDLPYVWESFYKVDKARVRNNNGCGIGLSIVREIVEVHQGSYEAGNDENGVYFMITVPKKEKG